MNYRAEIVMESEWLQNREDSKYLRSLDLTVKSLDCKSKLRTCSQILQVVLFVAKEDHLNA